MLQLKSAYRDGTTHIVMSPLQFMQRVAALVPRPRLHLIRFHGVLAPNAKLRAAIVPRAHSTSDYAAPNPRSTMSDCICLRSALMIVSCISFGNIPKNSLTQVRKTHRLSPGLYTTEPNTQ